MTEALYLTEEELRIFQNSAKVKNFVVSKSALDYEDSPEKTQARLSLLELEDKKLEVLRDKLLTGDISISQIPENLDFHTLSKKDCLEIVYALGPNIISSIICDCLINFASNDKINKFVASISHLRHLVFSKGNS